MRRLSWFNPETFQNGYLDFLTRSGIKITDPVSGGECAAFNLGYFQENEYQISLAVPKLVNNNINPLYKILETTPIQIQHKPFMVEFLNSADAEHYDLKLIKVNRVLQVQTAPEHGVVYFKKVIISKLDNLKFMRAVSRQRWMYGDNITKGGTRG